MTCSILGGVGGLALVGFVLEPLVVRAVLRVLLVLRVEVVDGVRHYVPRVHRLSGQNNKYGHQSGKDCIRSINFNLLKSQVR